MAENIYGKLASLGLMVATTLCPSLVWAANDHEEAARAGVSVQAHADTEVPITVGAGMRVMFPHGVLGDMAVGYVPGFYVDLMNDILVEAGAYDDDTATLIHDSLDSSLSWSTRFGWKPWKTRGLYVSVGYRLIALGGNSTATALLESASGRRLARVPGQFDSLDATMTLHMMDTQIGWSWGLGNHWVIRMAAGVSLTLAASARLEARNAPLKTPMQQEFLSFGENYLRNTATSYIHPPYLLLSVGKQF